MTCNEVVDQVRDTLRAVRSRVQSEFEPLTEEQLRWQPAPERWGVGHCLAHLAEVRGHCIRGVETALERAEGKGLDGGGAPYRPGWLGRRFVQAMAPDSELTVKTGARFRPGEVPTTVVSDYLEGLDRWDPLLGRARGLDLSGVRAASPASRLIRLRLADLLLLLANHERRHLKQALAVAADPGFPGRSEAVPSS